MLKNDTWKSPEDFEEEKIIKSLVDKYDPIHYYVDIGAGDGINMSNTFRLAREGWEGLCFECDKKKASVLLGVYSLFKNVEICPTVVTPENICKFMQLYNINKDFGFLSLDIDSYDYFILDSVLKQYHPSILCVEINPLMPPPIEFTVKYPHKWDKSSFFGMSICQLNKLCQQHNYAILQLEIDNAFCVSKNYGDVKELSPSEVYRKGYTEHERRHEKVPHWDFFDHLLNKTHKELLDYYFTLFDERGRDRNDYILK